MLSAPEVVFSSPDVPFMSWYVMKFVSKNHLIQAVSHKVLKIN